MTVDLFDRIMDAHRGLRPQVPVSTLERSSALSDALGCELYFKTEHLQPIGAFKVRGSANKVRVLGEAARNGVITASTGNHGLGVARAGRLAGVPVTVYVGKGTDAGKCRGIEAQGAKVHHHDGNALEAELAARADAAAAGLPYVPPYNDYDVIAGQGTLGVELHEQADALDAVFICVGGGGLMAGVGTALRRLRPATTIVGVWPAASTNMRDSIEAGRIVDTPESPTLSDGSTGGIEPGSVTFPICRDVIDEMVTVDEDEIARAMKMIAESEHWIVEGSAGVALAGLVQTQDQWRGKTVAVVLCGRNVTLDTFLKAMAQAA